MQYELKRSKRARLLRITVHRGGVVVVTAPYRTPEFFVRQFVARKARWIAKTVARQQKRPPSVLPSANPADFKKYKRQTYELIHARLMELNKIYGFSFRSITIRNQKTLWGSCSKAGDLSFNYRLLFLPPQLRDYVIVHELCHLKEHNHSARFWSLVSQAITDPKRIRKQFRTQGFTLS